MSIDDDLWASAALEAEDTHLVQVPAGAIDALGRGNLEDAQKYSTTAMTPYLVSPECLGVWRMRGQQSAGAPADTAWATRLIVDFGAGRTVGWAGFRGAPDPFGMVEIGYAVDPTHRRKGYARAALVILLEKAAALPDVRTVRTSISVENMLCRRLVTQYGFRDIGERQKDYGGLETIFELTLPSDRHSSESQQESDDATTGPSERTVQILQEHDGSDDLAHQRASSSFRRRLTTFVRNLTSR